MDHDKSRNLGNSNRINSDNYIDNDINQEYNNAGELVKCKRVVDSNENSHRNLDSSNNFIKYNDEGQ